jgi:preprotein translocase subunit SecB
MMNKTTEHEQKTDAVKMNGHDAHSHDPVFNVHSVYVKDVSFEAPHSPQVFQEEWKPKIDFDLKTESHLLSETEALYEVVLNVTVTAKLGEEKTEKNAFLIEVEQAGVFTLRNFPAEQIKQILATACPTVLFPYVREVISNLATKGGFPQLILPPLNFDAMYEHHASTQSSEPQATQTGTVPN